MSTNPRSNNPNHVVDMVFSLTRVSFGSRIVLFGFERNDASCSAIVPSAYYGSLGGRTASSMLRSRFIFPGKS